MSLLDSNIPLLICDQSNHKKMRKACNNAWMGFSVHHNFFAWQRDISTGAIRGRRLQRKFDKIVNWILGVFCFFSFAQWFLYLLVLEYKFLYFAILKIFYSPFVPIWFLMIILMFLISRLARNSIKNEFVHEEAAFYPLDNVSWEQARHYHKSAFHNIANSWTLIAMNVFEETAIESHEHKKLFSLYTFFAYLLKTSEVSEFLIRYELSPKDVLEQYKRYFHEDDVDHGIGNKALWQTIARSYLDASKNNAPKVTVFHLFEVCFLMEPEFEKFFEEIGVQPKMLENGIEWFRFRNNLRRDMREFRRVAVMRSTNDVGSAMTGLATPLLNAIGEDITKAAQFGYLHPTVGRKNEISSLVRAFESGSQAVLFVGEHGVGKMSVIDGLAEKIVSGNIPELLKDKRLIRVPVAHIVSGENSASYQNRLMQVIVEAVRAQNVILAFDGIEGLAGVRVGGDSGQDLLDTLAELLEKTHLIAVATTSSESFREIISGTKFAGVATKIDILPVEDNDAIKILEARALSVEAEYSVFFTYKAIEQCVLLARRFIQDLSMPASAIKLMSESAVYVRNNKGENSLVLDEDIAYVIEEKTNVPVADMKDDEREKLLRLERIMHERIVGQDKAVVAVSNALKRARVNLGNAKRPIASFLFLGPTGVGKTETVKTLSKVYFGSEERMIRFDMSEYQDSQSVYRLIGQPGEQGTGQLTEAVKQNPFSCVLLDEFEKADSGILNVFLQVFDDGRLTDSTGHIVDFTNTIIIATSNAGSQYIQDSLRKRLDIKSIEQTLIERELQNYFKPELLNRFDGIIVFSPLNEEQIEEIAHLIIDGIGTKLYSQRGIHLDVTDKAVHELAIKGYSPEFGARPMRRVIQSEVEDKLANILLEGLVQRNQTIVIDAGGKVKIE